MAIEEFTASWVRRYTGVSYETLNFWAKIGLVRPSISAASGSGTRRIYDFQDLVAIQVALKLRRIGVFGRSLVRVLDLIRDSGFDSITEVAVKVPEKGNEVELILGEGERMSARRRPGQLLLDFRIDCSEVAEGLRTRIDQDPKRSAKRLDGPTSKFSTKEAQASRTPAKRRASG